MNEFAHRPEFSSAIVDRPEQEMPPGKHVFLLRLKHLGVLREKNGLKIWDEKRLRQMPVSDRSTIDGRLQGLLPDNPGKSRFKIFELLKDESGVTSAEYKSSKDKSKLENRSLLYLPNDLNTAFDPAIIAADRSILGYWDISETGKVKDWDREVVLPSGEKVALNELYLSKKIFGDLKARRDQNGNLLIWDEDEEKWRKFSANFFLEKFGYKGGRGGSRSITIERPVEYLRDKCPQLLKRGLLRPDDFGVQPEHAGQFFRQQHTVSANGMTAINGARYILGKEFDTKKRPEDRGRYFVIELSDGVAGVVEQTPAGIKKVICTFRLKSEEEKKAKSKEILKRLRRGEIGSSSSRPSERSLVAQYLVFGRDEIDLQPYQAAADNRPLPGENSEEYERRIRSVSDYGGVEDLARALSMAVGVGIHKQLSYRQQQWLAAAAMELPGAKERVVENTKKYGVDFLKTFLSCEYGLHNGEKILDLAERLPPAAAARIFHKYSQIIIGSERAADYLAERYGQDKNFDSAAADLVCENMLRRGKDMISEFADSARAEKNNKIAPADAGKILADLEHINTEVMMLASSFRAMSKERNIELKDVKGLEIATKDSAELSAREKSEMTRIFMANRVSNRAAYPPQWLAQREREFVKLLKTAGKEFYLLFDGDNLLSFAHSEPGKQGRVYVGSLNTDPNARRNKIGSAFFKSVLDQVGQNAAVEIVVNKQNTMFDHYVKDFGFEVVREMEKGGLPYAELVRPSVKSGGLRLASSSKSGGGFTDVAAAA